MKLRFASAIFKNGERLQWTFIYVDLRLLELISNQLYPNICVHVIVAMSSNF
jgi:hypothetical protein